MPAEFVLNAMSDIKKVFDYPDDLNDWIRDKLHDRWRNHKHSVKKEGFFKYTTQEERLAHRPKDVVESQWGPLIEYWQNPHEEAKFAKRKANKTKQTVQHRSGSKSHVKYAAELEAKLKRPPTAQEIFDATHANQKMQIEGLENKPIRHSSQSSSTRQNDAIMQAESDESLEDLRMANGGEEGQLARKVRGPRSLKFLDTLLPGQRLQVQSWLNSPVGPNSTYLTTYISHLSKDGNKLPLTITHWNQMPAVFVLSAVLEVKKVFDCPDDLDDWIRDKLHDRWKSHKHSVKREGFYKYTTLEERLAHRPKDVVESQWGPLMEYWQDPRQEAKSAKIKERQAKQTVRHSGGAKPHVKYAAELEAKLKRPPTAQEIYDATHAKRKKQMETLENKPSQQSSSIIQNHAIMQAESDGSLEGFGMANGREEGQLARKVRGPRSLKFLDTLPPGQRLQVESWLNSPVGPNSTYMTTYISHLAKDGNKLPLTITHWNQMPAVFVLNAVLEVKKVFDCPDDLNDWIIAKLHDRWKDHKHVVKKEGFYKYTTQEERLSHRPKDVVDSQWGPLIEYWQDPRQEAKAAKMKEKQAKQTVRHSGGPKPHVKYAAELEAKLKRPPTAQEIYDATHAKRKKQMEALESKPSQQSSESPATRQNHAIVQLTGQDLMSHVSSSKKMKMSAEASGCGEINEVSRPEHLPLSRSNSIPTSPVLLIQECVTEDDEDNIQAESDEFEDSGDNMQAESDESSEDFGSAGEPVEAARTTSSSEPVEVAKTTSTAKCPTIVSESVPISSPKDISAPFVKSTSVSDRGSDEEYEIVDNFQIPKEYAVLYKMIFGKYGHMATKKVIKSNDTLLVACVTGLLKIISTMETVRGVDLSEALLESWDGEIEDAENLGFNIKWLRNAFDEIKNNWESSSGTRKEVEIHEKELDATQVKYVDLLARKEVLHLETSKVIIEIRKAEAKISSEKKTIQEKLGPKSNFLNEPVLGKVLS